jgi:hypothetical protein
VCVCVYIYIYLIILYGFLMIFLGGFHLVSLLLCASVLEHVLGRDLVRF